MQLTRNRAPFWETLYLAGQPAAAYLGPKGGGGCASLLPWSLPAVSKSLVVITNFHAHFVLSRRKFVCTTNVKNGSFKESAVSQEYMSAYLSIRMSVPLTPFGLNFTSLVSSHTPFLGLSSKVITLPHITISEIRTYSLNNVIGKKF